MESLVSAWSLFQKGGLMMYVLLACSFAVVAITAERVQFYRSLSQTPAAFLQQLQTLLAQQRLAEALTLCEKTPGAIAQLGKSALTAQQQHRSVEIALESTAMLIAARLREYLNYLSAIVTLAPLFGLLGTVLGMIQSFSVFNLQAGQPAAITGGVGEALVATAAGLCVAALAMISHTYFSHRLDQLCTDMEQHGAQLRFYAVVPPRTLHETA